MSKNISVVICWRNDSKNLVKGISTNLTHLFRGRQIGVNSKLIGKTNAVSYHYIIVFYSLRS